MNQDRQQQQVEHKYQHEYKKIMLIGRSGDGKSPFTDHLGGKFADNPSPCCAGSCVRLYISKQHHLKIIDAKGLDGSKTDKENQVVMDEMYQKTISHVDTALDAIIIMWYPLNNGHLVLLKTIKALEKSFGKDVTNSCIFMTQGNWESVAKLGDLDKAKITDQIKDIEEQFSHVPQGKYETKLPARELKKQLEDMMKKIQQYKVETFKEQQKLQSEKVAQEEPRKLSQGEVKEEEEEEKEEEEAREERKEGEGNEEEKDQEEEKEGVETMQPIIQEAREERKEEEGNEEEKDNEEEKEEVETIQPIIQEERIGVPQIIKQMLKVGSILTGSGAVTGMAAIAFEQSIFLAAGTIGVTFGALCLAAAAGTGAYHGLSWAVQRARGIRA